jgi:hypothetical protein
VTELPGQRRAVEHTGSLALIYEVIAAVAYLDVLAFSFTSATLTATSQQSCQSTPICLDQARLA